MKKGILLIVLIVFQSALLSCGGGGSSPAPATTVTVTGTISVNTTDLDVSAGLPGQTDMVKGSATKTNVPADNFTVTVYKIDATGTETPTAYTATTDSSGTYTINDLPVPPVGNGASTDYYYIVKATNVDETLEVTAPTAPSADTTVNASPETTIVTKLMTNVAQVPETTNIPMPSAVSIEASRILAETGVETLSDKTTLSLTASTNALEDTKKGVDANAIGTAGINTEWVLNGFEAQAEAVILKNDPDVTDTRMSQYLERVAKMGCQFDYSAPVFRPIMEVLGEKFAVGTQYTPTEIVAAYNTNKGGNPTVDLTEAVDQFKTYLTSIETAISNQTEIPSDSLAGILYVDRGLSSSTFSATTALDPDQTFTFLMKLFPETEFHCDQGQADTMGTMATLTGETALTEPQIVTAQVWNSSSVDCMDAGRLEAEVEVYTGSRMLDTVTISGGDIVTPITLSDTYGNIRRMPSGTTQCVTINKSVTYTVTANFTSGVPVTTTVTRNHPQVPEVTTTFADGASISDDLNNPTSTGDVRPEFKWDPPDEVFAQIIGAPEGSSVKYTYEFAYIDVTDDSIGPIPECGGVSIGGSRKLYDTNDFILSVDCDVNACAALQPERDVNNLRCRTNIATYLVDQYDSLLGGAAGDFHFFCIIGDGSCGS